MSTEIRYFEKLEKKYGRITFGIFLKSWRQAEGLNQTQFAKQLSLSIQNLNDLEKGRKIPKPTRVAKIAKKIKVSEMPLIQLALRDSLYAEGFKYNVNLERVS